MPDEDDGSCKRLNKGVVFMDENFKKYLNIVGINLQVKEDDRVFDLMKYLGFNEFKDISMFTGDNEEKEFHSRYLKDFGLDLTDRYSYFNLGENRRIFNLDKMHRMEAVAVVWRSCEKNEDYSLECAVCPIVENVVKKKLLKAFPEKTCTGYILMFKNPVRQYIDLKYVFTIVEWAHRNTIDDISFIYS